MDEHACTPWLFHGTGLYLFIICIITFLPCSFGRFGAGIDRVLRHYELGGGLAILDGVFRSLGRLPCWDAAKVLAMLRAPARRLPTQLPIQRPSKNGTKGEKPLSEEEKLTAATVKATVSRLLPDDKGRVTREALAAALSTPQAPRTVDDIASLFQMLDVDGTASTSRTGDLAAYSIVSAFAAASAVWHLTLSVAVGRQATTRSISPS